MAQAADNKTQRRKVREQSLQSLNELAELLELTHLEARLRTIRVHDPLEGPNFGLLQRRQGTFLARVPELLSVHRSHGAERCLGNLRSSVREAWAKMDTEVHIL